MNKLQSQQCSISRTSKNCNQFNFYILILKVAIEKIPALEDEDNEVIHETFFGENFKRLIKAFKN